MTTNATMPLSGFDRLKLPDVLLRGVQAAGLVIQGRSKRKPSRPAWRDGMSSVLRRPVQVRLLLLRYRYSIGYLKLNKVVQLPWLLHPRVNWHCR